MFPETVRPSPSTRRVGVRIGFSGQDDGRQGRLADYLTRLDFVILDVDDYVCLVQLGHINSEFLDEVVG